MFRYECKQLHLCTLDNPSCIFYTGSFSQHFPSWQLEQCTHNTLRWVWWRDLHYTSVLWFSFNVHSANTQSSSVSISMGTSVLPIRSGSRTVTVPPTLISVSAIKTASAHPTISPSPVSASGSATPVHFLLRTQGNNTNECTIIAPLYSIVLDTIVYIFMAVTFQVSLSL